MAAEIVMPRLTDSMEEGTLVRWLVRPGDRVERGQPIAEIETDKATMTYDSDTEGVVIELVAEEGQTLPIGAVIARIGDPAEAPQRAEAPERAEAPPAAAAPQAAEEPPPVQAEEPAASMPAGAIEHPAETQPASGTSSGVEETAQATAKTTSAPEAGAADGRLRASPLARRLARELGIDLRTVRGSGPGGRIVRADVEALAASTRALSGERRAEEGPQPGAIAPPPPPPPPPAAPEAPPRAPETRAVETARGRVEVEELDRTQQTIARRMAESKATVPDFALERTVDMEGCRELRERLRARVEPLPTYNDLVVKACALALREHRRLNGSYRDGRFELHERINVGIAVARPNALIVPTIFDADRKSLLEIAREARRLVERARSGEITPPELSGGTFTVSNLGMFGIDRFTAIINPPQAAILTVGAVAPRPAVDEHGSLCVRHLATLTLVCDHRIVYGADGAQFLARVAELLEEPLAMLVEG